MTEGQIDLTTGEVAQGEPIEDATVEVYQEGTRRTGDLGLADVLNRPETAEDVAPEEFAYRAIVEQILTSETVRDVLTPIEAVGARDMLDRPFALHAVDYRESEFEAGAPLYAVMQVQFTDDGERMVLTTGNQAMLAQLITLQTKHDAAHKAWQAWDEGGHKGKEPQPVFPVQAKIAQVGAKLNRYGNPHLRLVAPDWKPKDRTRK